MKAFFNSTSHALFHLPIFFFINLYVLPPIADGARRQQQRQPCSGPERVCGAGARDFGRWKNPRVGKETGEATKVA